MRMLAVFEKGERIRHIGHLDIQRSVQRGLRRSGLPVAYSQGFNPHILITFASALSTGACGKREIMDVTMAEDVDAEVFVKKMNQAMPPEMQIREARAVDNKHPSLMGMVAAAEYDLMIRDDTQGEKLASAVEKMMERDEIMAMRKTKTKMAECDIKPLIHALRAEKNDGKWHLRAMLTLTERESCKPQMLIQALAREAGTEDEVRVLVTREGLYGAQDDGTLVALEKL